MKVSFVPLDMKSSKYAISTVQETSALPRRVGSREVILTERLGDFYTGKKKITSSALNKRVSSEETEEVDELREYYQRKEQSAINRASMVRGKNSMVEDAEEEALVTDENVVNDDHVPKKRRTADNHDQTFHDALYQDDEPREEFKSQLTQDCSWTIHHGQPLSVRQSRDNCASTELQSERLSATRSSLLHPCQKSTRDITVLLDRNSTSVKQKTNNNMTRLKLVIE